MATIRVAAPAACTSVDLTAFQRLVTAGGEVHPGPLPGLLVRARALAFAREAGVLVGVAGVKCPAEDYRAQVFAKAGSRLAPAAFACELGWFYVSPGARGRGLAGALLASLLPLLAGRAAYATSRTTNAPMHAALRHGGFVAEGDPYQSRLGRHAIQLFVRDAGA